MVRLSSIVARIASWVTDRWFTRRRALVLYAGVSSYSSWEMKLGSELLGLGIGLLGFELAVGSGDATIASVGHATINLRVTLGAGTASFSLLFSFTLGVGAVSCTFVCVASFGGPTSGMCSSWTLFIPFVFALLVVVSALALAIASNTFAKFCSDS